MADEDRYQDHDRKLTQLATRMEAINSNLDQAVDRVQLLVDQYHAQNVVQATMEGSIQQGLRDIHDIKTALDTKFALRDEFLTVRNQLWTGIGVVVLGVASAVVAWIVRGGLASGVR